METTEEYLIKLPEHDIEIKRIIELSDSGSIPLIPAAKPENLKELPWLFPNFLSKSYGLKIIIQMIIIKSKGKTIIIDTCIGNHKKLSYRPWANRNSNFLEKLIAIGVEKEKVDIVVCTHIHLDHVGWNTIKKDGIWRPTFCNAEYIFSEQEFKHIKQHESSLHGDIIKESINPVVEAGQATFISPPHAIDNNISIIGTPGHTPGHISVIIDCGSLNLLVTGDMIHHPCQIAYPDWCSYYDFDKNLAIKTRRRFLEKNVEQNTLIIGSHFSSTSIGRIIKDSDKYAFDILYPNGEKKN